MAIVLVAVLFVLLASSQAHGKLQDFFRVSYIDVGQGDSILLHTSDDVDILIDGGPSWAGPTVVAYLENEGIDDIEVMVLTHAHADHVGGLLDVLSSTIPVEAVIYNGLNYTTSAIYQEFISDTESRNYSHTCPGSHDLHLGSDRRFCAQSSESADRRSQSGFCGHAHRLW